MTESDDEVATAPARDMDFAQVGKPDKPCHSEDDNLLDCATHILATEAAALSNITHLYQTHPQARLGLTHAVQATLTAQAAGGKLIVSGVGKSAYIAMKLVATCKSLGISASFLHACEALHGDLGDIRGYKDVLLFISFSGKTPELLNLLPHLPEGTRVMAMTSHTRREDCLLLVDRDDGVLIPTPIPEKEEATFGVAAPTTSTTVALAVADMLALTVADQLHTTRTREVFKRNHPGGAIGMTQKEVEKLKKDGEDFVVLELPSPSISGSDDG